MYVVCSAPTAAPVLQPRAQAAQTAEPTSYYPIVTQIPVGSQQPAQQQLNTRTAQPQAQSEEPTIPTLQPLAAASTVPATQPIEVYGTTPEYGTPPT
jgi:hypothetical protein